MRTVVEVAQHVGQVLNVRRVEGVVALGAVDDLILGGLHSTCDGSSE
jgi:hypothetical protein